MHGPDLHVTPLQERLEASYRMLADARDQLDDSSYETYIAVLLERVQTEAGRLVIGEALRATRDAAV